MEKVMHNVLDGYGVTPDYRSQGIGSRLVVESIELAAKMGALELYSHPWKAEHGTCASRSLHIHKKHTLGVC